MTVESVPTLVLSHFVSSLVSIHEVSIHDNGSPLCSTLEPCTVYSNDLLIASKKVYWISVSPSMWYDCCTSNIQAIDYRNHLSPCDETVLVAVVG
jgi:hypothetical protein